MGELRNRLEESHKDLHQWFLLHQESLLLHRDDFAKDAIEAFGEYLCRHIEFENAYVLSATGIAEHLRWNTTVYEKEHEKLIRMLVEIQQMLLAYYPLTGREKRLALLELLEKELSFFHVLEHHEQREEQDLFEYLQQLDASVLEIWNLEEKALHQTFEAFKKTIKKFLENN